MRPAHVSPGIQEIDGSVFGSCRHERTIRADRDGGDGASWLRLPEKASPAVSEEDIPRGGPGGAVLPFRGDAGPKHPASCIHRPENLAAGIKHHDPVPGPCRDGTPPGSDPKPRDWSVGLVGPEYATAAVQEGDLPSGGADSNCRPVGRHADRSYCVREGVGPEQDGGEAAASTGVSLRYAVPGFRVEVEFCPDLYSL